MSIRTLAAVLLCFISAGCKPKVASETTPLVTSSISKSSLKIDIKKYRSSDIPAISKYFEPEMLGSLKKFEINELYKDSCSYLFNYEDIPQDSDGISDTSTMNTILARDGGTEKFGTYYKWVGGKAGWASEDGIERDLRIIGRIQLGKNSGIYVVERMEFNVPQHVHYLFLKEKSGLIQSIPIAEFGHEAGPKRSFSYLKAQSSVLLYVVDEYETMEDDLGFFSRRCRERRVEFALDPNSLQSVSLDSLRRSLH